MSKQLLRLIVNGENYEVYIDPSKVLRDVLRDELGLTGVKEGCDTGDCGACTVLIDGKAVKSCLILAFQANGEEIMTIEGLANGNELHPLQQSFIDHYAVQCGYCTPGVIMSAKALLDENPNPTETEVRRALRGNLCRCSGYVNITRAILDAKQAKDMVRR
ncbi:(2Fe-2S)-binding protein [Chloroflexota bacterium]